MLLQCPATGWFLHVHTKIQTEMVTFLVEPVQKKFFMCVCSEAETFVTRGPKRIGSRYKKARYVEYTDNTFTTKMLRSPEEQHLGILGNSS